MRGVAQVKPNKLPRHGTAPIAVFVSGHLQNANGGIPPQLRKMRILVNKHGLLQSKGLARCRIPCPRRIRRRAQDGPEADEAIHRFLGRIEASRLHDDKRLEPADIDGAPHLRVRSRHGIEGEVGGEPARFASLQPGNGPATSGSRFTVRLGS